MTSWGMDEAAGYAAGLLEGERVRLRELREPDLAQLDGWWRDPAVSVFNTFVVRPQPQGATVDMFRRWSANDGPASVGFSVERRDDGALAGHVALFGISPKDRHATFAIVMGPPHQGRGFGTEATRLTVRYGFLELGLHRIELGVYAFNHRAIGAYAKAGFVEEGHRRQRSFHDGAFHDELLMAILRPEWDELQRREASGSGRARRDGGKPPS